MFEYKDGKLINLFDKKYKYKRVLDVANGLDK
jgi:hypothetical protein